MNSYEIYGGYTGGRCFISGYASILLLNEFRNEKKGKERTKDGLQALLPGIFYVLSLQT